MIPCIEEMCKGLKIHEKQQLEKVMLISDADRKNAVEKKNYILNSGEYSEDFQILGNGGDMVLQLDVLSENKRILIPLKMYIFPDDENSGTLESLLLESAEIVYPDLKINAEAYINSVDPEQYCELQDAIKTSKATIGCIANVLKPGKANQVALADSEWIGNRSLQCNKVNKLFQAVGEFLDILHE